MTYNEVGFYGHPDHIQAHRITMAAIALLDYEPTRLLQRDPQLGHGDLARALGREEATRIERRGRRAEGIEREPEVPTVEAEEIDLGTPDERIDATVDVSTVDRRQVRRARRARTPRSATRSG